MLRILKEPGIWLTSLLFGLWLGHVQAAPNGQAPAHPAAAMEALRQELEHDPVHLSQQAHQLATERERAGDRLGTAGAQILELEAYAATESYDKAEPLLESAAKLLLPEDPPELHVRLLLVQASVAAARGTLRVAHQLYEQAERRSGELKLTRERIAAMDARARLFLRDGRYSDALRLFTDAHQSAEKLGLRREMAACLDGMASVQARTGNMEMATQYHERALAELNPRHDTYLLSELTYNYAKTLLDSNDLLRARTLFESVLMYARELRDAVGVAYAQFQLGTLAHKRGEDAEAEKLLHAALAEFQQSGNLDLQLRATLALAETLATHDAATATVLLGSARALLAQKVSLDNELLLHKSIAAIYRAQGRYREALAEMDAWVALEARRDTQFSRSLIAELQEQFELRTKEAENKLLKSEQQRHVAEVQISEQRQVSLLLALVAGAVLLAGMGTVLVLQIRSKRAYANLALVDTLTNAPNRRHILEYAHLQMRACDAAHNPLTLAIVDLDHFKQVNDQLGHDCGDAVLCAFASAVSAELRGGARLGRLGGEEWLLVLPSTQAEQTQPLFERLRAVVQTARPTSVPADFPLTFSMGAAQVRVGETLDQLLKRADGAMYQAKQQGRDRMVVATTVAR